MIDKDAPTRFWFTDKGRIFENYEELTPDKVIRFYLFVRDHIRHYGYSPTRIEVRDTLGYATGTQNYYVAHLEGMELIRRVPTISRNLLLVE